MKEKEFYELVRRMRQTQNAYFATRRSQYLELAKKLEQQVDAAVKKYNDTTFYPQIPFN